MPPIRPSGATVAAALTASAAVVLAAMLVRVRRRGGHGRTLGCSSSLDLIGNTPLVHLRALSEMTGCTILAKAEFLNPGGSSKDRVALAMVREAEASGQLLPGGALVEATAGSTGVSLAWVARACGYRCLLVAADDTSPEKLRLIRALGASLEVVKPASIANPGHAVNVARRRASEFGAGSVFCDQFNNLANMRAHEHGTGREIWEQTAGAVDAFVMGAGTGGTIAGVSAYLKARKPTVRTHRTCSLPSPPRVPPARRNSARTPPCHRRRVHRYACSSPTLPARASTTASRAACCTPERCRSARRAATGAMHACGACVRCMRAVHACDACVRCVYAMHA